MQIKRLVVSALVPALAATVLASTSSSASAPGDLKASLVAAAGAPRPISADEIAWRPPSGDPDRIVRVIVELAGPSVAQAAGDAADAGVPFTDADAANAAARAATTQNGVISSVVALGGKVDRRNVHAVNTMTVSLPASAIDAMRADPAVSDVAPVRVISRDNGTSNGYTGVPQAWESLGVTGAGQTIAIIDSGVDYTHADFGGSGNPADFAANDPLIIEPGSFPTAKVIGGVDLVGDAYDAASDDPARVVPQPDPDPIGCAPGGEHGTHVAGTAAGQGVLLDGSTFAGPYDTTVDPAQFLVSPGSAPEATILAYKVFGCEGSVDSDVVIAAIDQAVADGADIINMSLGSDMGVADGPEQAAVNNAARAGVVMVISAGNSGQAAYLVGGPSTADRAISVAAMDANVQFPGATLTDGASSVAAINANNSGALPLTGTLVVVPDGGGGISTGCDVAEFPPPTTPDTIYVVLRGVCDRVAKPANAQAAGGLALVMVNTAPDYPPFEGPIPGVDIPFLGVTSTSAPVLQALDGATVTLQAAGLLANPSYTLPASFTSGGPRSGDSAQKPDVIAPGVGVMSAGLGTGTAGIEQSGTSMASPHTAGIAALIRQVHPKWSTDMVKAAIVNTADPTRVGGFDTRVAGNGLVNAPGAVATDTVLVTRHGTVALNFGFHELDGGFSDVQTMTLRNAGNAPATYDLAPVWNSDPLGAVVTVSPNQVTVPAYSRQEIEVRLTISQQAVAALPNADLGSDSVITLRGQIVATPTSDDQPLSIAFMMAPHARSDIHVTGSKLKFGRNGRRFGTVSLANAGIHSGNADVYNWLLDDADEPGPAADGRALGVQYFPDTDPSDGTDEPLMVFAFTQFDRFSSPSQNYFHMSVDADHDDVADHEIFIIDHGLFEAGAVDGTMNTYVVDEDFNGFVYGADVPTDGSVALGFAFPSDLGMTATTGPASVVADVNSYTMGTFDPLDGVATINPFHPQASSGNFITIEPGDTASFPVNERVARRNEVAVKGWMVVTFDDASGAAQADLVRD